MAVGPLVGQDLIILHQRHAPVHRRCHDLLSRPACEDRRRDSEWRMAKFRDQNSNEARKLLDGALGTFPPERRLKEAEEAITRLANEETLEAQIAKLRAMSSEELAKVEI